MTDTANPFPPVVPIKKVEPADVPPLLAGFATVMIAVPAAATSAALIAASNCVLDIKVVLRAAPLNWIWAAGSKLLPFTVSVKAAAPAIAELGLSSVITGAFAAGTGGGAGKGLGVGNAVGTGAKKLPPTRTTWPLSVLNANPF